MTSVPILHVKDLRTYFSLDEGIVKAVDGVSFQLDPGRTLCIVGESGCGKSVCTKAILGLVEAPGKIVGGHVLLRRDSGDVIDLAAVHPRSRAIRRIRGGEIGLVFQEPMTALSVLHTVGNQLIEAIRLHLSLSKKEARFRAIELLRQVGIGAAERRLDEYPFQLSGGLRQRVMIALALAARPKVLIADEPTTALDVTTQAQILELLRRLQHEMGLALLLITHDMGVVAEMADDVLVMYLGRTVEYGPVDTVFHSPLHPYTRALLRSIPSMQARPRTRLAAITGGIPHPFATPSGCMFHPRCPEAILGRCEILTPQNSEITAGHSTACHLYSSCSSKS